MQTVMGCCRGQSITAIKKVKSELHRFVVYLKKTMGLLALARAMWLVAHPFIGESWFLSRSQSSELAVHPC